MFDTLAAVLLNSPDQQLRPGGNLRIYTSPVCEEHVNRNASVEAPERYRAMLDGVRRAKEAGSKVEVVSPEPASREALLAVHGAGYLDLLERTSASGGGSLDFDTAMNERSWSAALAASGAALGAVECALGGEAAFAVVRPPGHHAGPDYAMGFCLTNHAAAGAARAREMGASRVAVLDWDVHHGNGTQDIFYESGQVLYLSVHRGGAFYPGTGGAGEAGRGAGEGFTVNVPLRAGAGEEVYAAVFGGVILPVLREYAPEVVIVSAGFDAHASDPLGGMALRTASYGRFAASLAALAREVGAAPLTFVLEGGYDLAALSESLAATIEGAEGGDSSTLESPRTAEPLESVRRALGPYWECLRR